VYLANQRRGTVSTQTRSEVSVTTKKAWKQKGTGRARHGAKSAPIWVGGGLVFGPKPRDYSLKLTKKMKKLALFSALSSKLKAEEIKVIDGLEKIEPKTKEMAKLIKNIGITDKKRKILLVIPETKNKFENLYRSAKNVEGVNIINANMIHTYAALNNKVIFLTKQAIEVMEKSFLGKGEIK
jgi:large subunit ribosomal protein L4